VKKMNLVGGGGASTMSRGNDALTAMAAPASSLNEGQGDNAQTTTTKQQSTNFARGAVLVEKQQQLLRGGHNVGKGQHGKGWHGNDNETDNKMETTR
jgi:hypothetical protein